MKTPYLHERPFALATRRTDPETICWITTVSRRGADCTIDPTGRLGGRANR